MSKETFKANSQEDKMKFKLFSKESGSASSMLSVAYGATFEEFRYLVAEKRGRKVDTITQLTWEDETKSQVDLRIASDWEELQEWYSEQPDRSKIRVKLVVSFAAAEATETTKMQSPIIASSSTAVVGTEQFLSYTTSTASPPGVQPVLLSPACDEVVVEQQAVAATSDESISLEPMTANLELSDTVVQVPESSGPSTEDPLLIPPDPLANIQGGTEENQPFEFLKRPFFGLNFISSQPQDGSSNSSTSTNPFSVYEPSRLTDTRSQHAQQSQPSQEGNRNSEMKGNKSNAIQCKICGDTHVKDRCPLVCFTIRDRSGNITFYLRGEQPLHTRSLLLNCREVSNPRLTLSNFQGALKAAEIKGEQAVSQLFSEWERREREAFMQHPRQQSDEEGVIVGNSTNREVLSRPICLYQFGPNGCLKGNECTFQHIRTQNPQQNEPLPVSHYKDSAGQDLTGRVDVIKCSICDEWHIFDQCPFVCFTTKTPTGSMFYVRKHLPHHVSHPRLKFFHIKDPVFSVDEFRGALKVEKMGGNTNVLEFFKKCQNIERQAFMQQQQPSKPSEPVIDSRNICRYYNSLDGCKNGTQCKYVHQTISRAPGAPGSALPTKEKDPGFWHFSSTT